MLKLNASVHSWLTKQERRLQNAIVEQQLKEAAAKVGNIELLEEKDELESEHKKKATGTAVASAGELQLLEADSTTGTATTTKTTMITVTDSNGNQVESHTATTTSTSTNHVGTCTQTMATASTSATANIMDKNWDLQSLITSENEFHKHLKDEVSDMYTAWDEADSR